MCYTCVSGVQDPADGYDSCLMNPNGLSMCAFPYQKYCYSSDTGRKFNGGFNNIIIITAYSLFIKPQNAIYT